MNPIDEELIAAADFYEELKQPDFVFDFEVVVAGAVLLGIYELDKLVQRFKNSLRVVKDEVFSVRRKQFGGESKFLRVFSVQEPLVEGKRGIFIAELEHRYFRLFPNFVTVRLPGHENDKLV